MSTRDVSALSGGSQTPFTYQRSRAARNAAVWLLVGAGCAAPAIAEESRLYIGASVGSAEHAKSAALQPRDVPLMTGEAGSRDTSWNLAVGFQPNPNIAFELGYRHLGTVEASLADPTGSTDAQAQSALTSEGVTVSMLGRFPIGKWTPYIRAGVLFSQTELQFSGTVSGARFAGRVTDDSESAFFGAGLRFDIGSQWALQADFTHVMDAAGPRFGQSDCHDASIGVIWKF